MPSRPTETIRRQQAMLARMHPSAAETIMEDQPSATFDPAGRRWLILLFILFAFTLIPFRPLEMIRDSVYWAGLVETLDPRIWHPHHLIYMPINALLLEFLRIFYADSTAIDAGQVHSAFWMLIAVLCTRAIALKATGSHPIAFLLAGLLLTSQMAWVFAMQPQAYAPLMGALSLLLWTLFSTRPDEYSTAWMIKIAALYAITVLYHQAMVLICFPLGYYLYSTKGKNGLRAALMVLFTSGAVVLSLYIWAASHVQENLSLQSFINYLTFFGQVMADPKYFNFQNYSWANSWVLLQSQFNAFQLPVWSMREGVLGVFFTGLVVMLAWNIRQILSKARHRQERSLLLFVLAIFWTLTLWGNPTDDGWPTFILIPLFFLLSISLGDGRDAITKNTKNQSLVFIALLLALTVGAARNLHGRILPMHQDEGVDYHWAEAISSVTPVECIVLETRMLAYYNLGYYFERKIRDYWDIITAAYYGSEQQRKAYFGEGVEASCLVIDSRYLHPSYSVSGKTASDFPGEWIGLLSWIFDIQKAAEGTYQWRDFDFIRANNGASYLLISRERTTDSQPIGRFWKRLSEIDAISPAVTGSVAQWLEDACRLPDSARQPLHSATCEARFDLQ